MLLSSPEYAHGIPGAFKNALDWLVGSVEFPGTPVALLSPSPWSVHAPAQLRAAWPDGEAVHHVRLYDVLPGHSRIPAVELSDAALGHWGETAARLARALRGFAHPRAQRTMPWDVQHALTARAAA